MRRNFEREHENCPHCGRNSCSWHMPGRFCWYAYEDLPGEVKRKGATSCHTSGHRNANDAAANEHVDHRANGTAGIARGLTTKDG
jgi:hypothetical protein